jgi:hypothetical protein
MLNSFFRTSAKVRHARRTQRQLATLSLFAEQLEDRSVPSTFNVLNLNDSGAGSLRQAILGANAHAGTDTIDFNLAGTIRLTSGALPAITGTVDIDGSTAPGFAGTPVVAIDYNHFGGFQFNSSSGGSSLLSLDLVDASGNGVTLYGGGSMLILGNYIGIGLDGTTIAGNSGNGLQLNSSSGNTIGGTLAQDRNIISGNRGNGIYISGSSNNQIIANYIGTDATGTLDRGNSLNGILLTAGAKGNIIGGVATGGNDPTNSVFVIPPQGNLISGNNANGVLIDGYATQNTLSGNFIGTAASGNSALGNSLDGVAIMDANGNSLSGCTFLSDPFVFYNVISGNGANGLQVTNSNNTTIQGNFFGVGANNTTAVGNSLNGVVVEGSSSNTVMGGPIPLGNVDAANGQNGILVQGSASFFTSYNTFCGLAAFKTLTNLGNGLDGMKITSTGGNILIRTNVIAENGNDGIEISGWANGVLVSGNFIGLNTTASSAMGNKNNGVEVDGSAYNIVIGGPQLTFNIIPNNVISANGGNGVAVDGNAHNVQVNFSYIGTDLTGLIAIGNAKSGVYLGVGTYSTTVGSTDPSLLTLISGNLGDGVEMRGTHGNTVIGAFIGTSVLGLLPLPNGGDGVYLNDSSNNFIGSNSAGANATSGGSANLIAFNGGNGAVVDSGNGNAIRQNSIFGNSLLGIALGSSANLNQVPPVLTSALAMPLGMQVSGTLSSKPNTTFTIEFFGNVLNVPSGRLFLGFMTVKTNAAGVAAFNFNGVLSSLASTFITATATDPNNNTSEFSAGVSSLLG